MAQVGLRLRVSCIVLLMGGAVLVGSIAAPARVFAAAANLPTEGASVELAKPAASAKTVLGDEPIRAESSPGMEAPPTTLVQPQGMDYPRVLGALGVVIGLIFVLRWVGRIFFPGATGRRASRAMEVLSRSPLSPKQQLVLIRVGRRLIVVGDSGSQMNALCEISDPDEIASLVGQLQDEKAPATARPFGSVFGSLRGAFETSSYTAPADEPPPTIREAEAEEITPGSAREELNGLRDRVRMLADQFKAG